MVVCYLRKFFVDQELRIPDLKMKKSGQQSYTLMSDGKSQTACSPTCVTSIVIGVSTVIALIGMILGAISIGYFNGGNWYTPSATIGALTVGAPIIEDFKRANARTDSNEMLLVGGSTMIAGDLVVTGAVITTATQTDCRGTTLTANKTSASIYQQNNFYDWSVSKVLASPNNLTLSSQQCFSSQYAVTAQRTILKQTFQNFISGNITVCNGGEFPTDNLKIDDVVQTKCITETAQTTTCDEEGV